MSKKDKIATFAVCDFPQYMGIFIIININFRDTKITISVSQNMDYENERDVSWFGRNGRIKFVPMWRWLVSDL